MSPRHRKALDHLISGVRESGGFVLLTGEVGTGKTTLIRCLLAQLPDDVDSVLIFNPRLNDVELLATICDELRIDYPANTDSLKALVDALTEYLLAAHARERRTVLIIDEAQNLTSKQMKTLVTRSGTGTKIVCLGNVEQIDTPSLTETTSGLTYVVDRFKHWRHSAHVTLRRGERSRLADFASEVL